MNEADLCEEDINELQKAITAIATMSSSDFKILLPLLQNRTIKKEDYILKEGDVCRNIFFLLNGFVRMYYVDFDGNEISYRFTDKGNFFVDFQSLLTQQPSHYYWQATQDSELLVFSYQEVQQVYKKSPAWNNFGRLMAERVYLQLNERVDMLLYEAGRKIPACACQTTPTAESGVFVSSRFLSWHQTRIAEFGSADCMQTIRPDEEKFLNIHECGFLVSMNILLCSYSFKLQQRCDK